jgi:hypothetical protein
VIPSCVDMDVIGYTSKRAWLAASRTSLVATLEPKMVCVFPAPV